VVHSAANGDLGRHGRTFRLIVTGGGSGGHTYPALATVRTLRFRLADEGRDLEVAWVGTARSLEERIAVSEGIAFQPVATGKLRRASNPLKMVTASNIRDLARVPLGVLQADRFVHRFRPDAVLATGGYVAVRVSLAARWSRRPLLVHEQTTRLGLANRIAARCATRVAVSAETTLRLLPRPARAGAVVTGNPVRPEVLTGQADAAVAALGWRGLDPELPVVYVTGGAQGSAQVNGLLEAILPWLLSHANVIHQCGAASVDQVRQREALLAPELADRYLVTGFIGAELPDVLALADVLVSRSGAGTLAEITALGKAAVLIPLPSAAGDEQRHNARHLADSGAAMALLSAVTPEALRKALESLLADPDLRARISANARAQGHPDAAERLAETVLSMVECFLHGEPPLACQEAALPGNRALAHVSMPGSAMVAEAGHQDLLPLQCGAHLSTSRSKSATWLASWLLRAGWNGRLSTCAAASSVRGSRRRQAANAGWAWLGG
jgi:UDP-N-acetylglucosamine--N-acetylmuramyl-(pentapeptide) pyrophosphoryl-undecaprenol N-acetylglucosamine transferase